jgi:hypothetical protein
MKILMRLALVTLCGGTLFGSATSTARVMAAGTRFDVNDVSFLWPPPVTAADVSALMSANDITTSGSAVWPLPAFNAVMASARTLTIENAAGFASQITLDEALQKPETWKVVAMRVDPSAPGGHPSLVKAFGSMPQIRLVLQPVTVSGAKVRVHDFAAHLVYHYASGKPAAPFTPDKDKFRDIVADLAALKAAAGTPTEGRLGIHPALKARNEKFAALAKGFVAKFVSAPRLFALSFIGVETPEPWIFMAMVSNGDGTGTIVDAPQAVLGKKSAQMLGLLVHPAATPLPSTTNVDTAAGRGVSTGVLFETDIAGRLTGSVFSGTPRPVHSDIPDIVANPERSHFFNTDCVSCHSESSRRKELNVSPIDAMFRFAVPAGVSGLDETLLPKDRWNVHNFGWFQRPASSPALATVTMRTANESAESADFINREYLGQPPGSAAQPAAATEKRGTMPNMVANPLTLVMDIKSPEDHRQLKALVEGLQALPPDKNPIVLALTKLKTVHFARFVFLSEKQLAVITSYDGTFEDYIDAFVNTIGEIFDKLLAHMQDAPPLPVSANRDAFLAYVKKHDLMSIPPFYSAYPTLTVQDILALQKQAAPR